MKAMLLALEASFSIGALVQFFLPAILGSLAVFFADAKKWMSSGEWDWGVFWSTKISPFLLSLGVAVVIYFGITFLPWTQDIFEALSGVNLLEFTAFSLMGMASAILNGILKKTKNA